MPAASRHAWSMPAGKIESGIGLPELSTAFSEYLAPVQVAVDQRLERSAKLAENMTEMVTCDDGVPVTVTPVKNRTNEKPPTP